MRDTDMPTQGSVGDSLDHDAAALKDVRRALDSLRDLEPSNPDATMHIANAERELRAAVRALRESATSSTTV